jgi:BTB/POZ domain
MKPFEEVILIERANLINNPDTSADVTFLVGENESEVTAHKVFLVSASEVFKAMFNKNFANDEKIKVTDLEVDAFIQVRRNRHILDRFSIL